MAIAAGFGYVAPVWIGLGLTVLGLMIAVLSFSWDGLRRRRGEVLGYGTELIQTVSAR